MFFDQNIIKLEIQNRKFLRKSPNTWKLCNAVLNNSWIKKNKV